MGGTSVGIDESARCDRRAAGALAIAVWLVCGGRAAEAQAPAEPAASAAAESDSRARRIEEIVVTAQKTEQTLQDVPISISVIDDEFIADQSITDYRDLALYTPNAHIDPGNGLFPDVNIRGYGSALSNKAFEQSVGLAIDGIPYGRAPYFQGPLFDLERVEVLRGPQGTLFGRNTTAGLLNVVTKGPTDDFTGFALMEYGELERLRFEGAVGGPILADVLNFRVSGLSDQRDGLVENTTSAHAPGANERMNDRDRQALRFQLELPDVRGLSLRASYERVDFDFTGIGWEADRVPEHVKPFYRQFDPDADFDPFNHVGSVDTDEFNRNRMETFVATAHYDVGDWGLDAVGGRSKVTVRSLIDDDFGPAPLIYNTSSDDNPQNTAEVRVSSPDLPGFLGLGDVFGFSLGSSRFLAGFFYQDRSIDESELTIGINLPAEAQFLAYNSLPAGTPIPPLDSFIGPAVQLGAIGVVDTLADPYARTTMLFGQETRSYAGFSHLSWSPLERWEIEYGMRYTIEEKEATWNRFNTPVVGNAFLLLGGEEFTAARDRSESAFTPKVSLRHSWSDEIGVYFTWSKGFKAGGYNEQSHNNSDAALEYASEKAEAYELGAKMQLLDQTLSLNLALFRHDVTDFQVLTLPPLSVSTTVINAGEARAQGVELDSMWLPASWLTLFGTLAFNDSEFLEFPFGQCSFDREDTDGNGDGRCDAKGQPLFRTPKWAAAVAASLRYPLASIPGVDAIPLLSSPGLDLIGGGSAEYKDVQFLERTYDERVRQSPFFRFGLNAGIGNEEQGWSLRIVVENLTDRKTGVLIRDVPLGGGNFYKIPEPQRLVFGSFRWAF